MPHALLIEPDAILRAQYRTAFEAADFTVAVAHDGQKAIHLADEKRPDIVILDAALPKHNGVEFLYEFRTYEEWQHIPVVALCQTNSMYDQLEAVSRQLGIAECLYKPTTKLSKLLHVATQTVKNAGS